MSTPFDTPGIIGPAGAKIVAALILPTGKTTAAGTQVTGGTVIGTAAVTAGSAKVYLGLTEEKPNIFRAESDVSGANLPDADLQRPYKVEARVVAGITDMTNYAAIGVAFEASTDVAYSPDVPPTLLGGILRGGTWYTAANVVGETLNARLSGDAFDGIPTTAPAGVATTFREMIVQLWRRKFKKATISGGLLKTYADDGTTVVTTQAATNDGTTQTQGAAT